MRKLDTLILKSFVGPFILTTLVATFVLLIQYMMKYFDDFVGKDLGFEVFAELLFYFSLNMLQQALPLGILVSSLMTFGNLGENFELTAIKSAGISLLRALRPIFFFVLVLTVGAFNFNNHIVPAANLKAYSLLYDIKHKKPALDIKEGVFYNGIPDYNIKVKEKLPDGKTMLDVMIYDHTDGKGNNRVILADSSRMYTFLNDKYLKLELYNGNYYSEEEKAREAVDQFFRTKFSQMEMVFSLSSFDLKRTNEDLFQNNRQMKNVRELTADIDSLSRSIGEAKHGFFLNTRGFFSYHLKNFTPERWEQENVEQENADSVSKQPIPKRPPIKKQYPLKKREMKAGVLNVPDFQINEDDSLVIAGESMEVFLDSVALVDNGSPDSLGAKVGFGSEGPPDSLTLSYLNNHIRNHRSEIIQDARNQVQNIKINLSAVSGRVESLQRNLYKWIMEKWKKYSQAFGCIVMFLIGAPLGAIIKKGGLGVPVIVSILFFLTYYVINITCEKWAREGLMDPILAVWVAHIILLPIGLFFLRQARIDARLFDTDFYNVWLDKLKDRFSKR